VILGNLDPDATKFNLLDVFKLIFMVGDVRFSEDCCVADNYIVDMANFGISHIAKITITAVKKLEVCAMVSFDPVHPPCDILFVLLPDPAALLQCYTGLFLH
jgi:hypothetical protein